MNLNQLTYFKTVCKFSNITKAAAELHVSQPAITKAIKELESELGIELFNRGHRKITITPEGKFFLQKCSNVLYSISSLIDEMKDFGSNKRRVVKIGIPPIIGTVVLPRLLFEIKDKLNIELEIFEASSPDTTDMVVNEELDLALVLFCKNEDKKYPLLDHKIIRYSDLRFCTSKHNHLANNKHVKISELENEHLISFSPNILAEDLFKANNIKHHYKLYTNQIVTVRNYIVNNIASTFQFPEAFAKDREIVSIPLSERVPLNFVVISKKWKTNCSAVINVLLYLQQEFEIIRSQ